MSEFCIEQFSILWQVDKNKRIYKQPKLWPRKFTCKRPLTHALSFSLATCVEHVLLGSLLWGWKPLRLWLNVKCEKDVERDLVKPFGHLTDWIIHLKLIRFYQHLYWVDLGSSCCVLEWSNLLDERNLRKKAQLLWSTVLDDPNQSNKRSTACISFAFLSLPSHFHMTSACQKWFWSCHLLQKRLPFHLGF